MGRWRGWRRSKHHSNVNNDSLWFHWRTRDDLLRYLQEYREGCWSFYSENQQFSAALDVLHENKKTTGTKSKSNKNGESSVTIGGVAFPPLTTQTLCEPYLKLPAELTKKQRRIVHECCIEQDLFHDSFDFEPSAAASYGDDDQHFGRCIVVSIYADGFDSLQRQQRSTPVLPSFDAHQCKPWYRRHDINASDHEQEEKMENDNIGGENQSYRARAEQDAIHAIYKLIDQPGDCLRDNVDDLVLREDASLADTVPPSTNDDDTWILVDSAAKMKLCADQLTAACPTEVAFDLEAFNVNKYTQLTCLLQIATNTGQEYVIDTLAPGVWTEVHRLAPLFGNPAIVKIGHSAASLDVHSLHRDFGIFVVNLFDTYEAAREMAIPALGLAAVCAHYGLPDCDTYSRLKATYQMCDWRVRPLTPPMIRYARYDVHYLVQLRQLMIRDMVMQGQQEPVFTEDRLVAESLSQTLAQIARAEEDAISDDDDGQYLMTPLNEKAGGLAFLDAEEEGAREEEVDDDDDEDNDSAFKTAPGLVASRSEDGSFFTSRINISRAVSFMTLEDSFMDANGEFGENGILTAADLRLQPVLMRVISTSQERCRTLWKGDSEQHRNNALFQSILKRAKHNYVTWDPSSTNLFDELVAWRERVAYDLECLPGFVAPLDFLVSVAWKRPATKHGLLRINTRLPPVLEQYPVYLNQLLDVVLQFSLQPGGSARTATVAFYSNLGEAAVTTKSRELDASSLLSIKLFSFDTALKVLVVGLLCEGFALAIMDARRKHR